MKTYEEKLKDPRWQKKRLEILKRDNWACQRCGDDESTLIVHHKYYAAENDPWDYPEKALVTLCEYCHDCERTERPDIERDLLHSLKLHFDVSGIFDIKLGFSSMEIWHESEIVASIIKWFLTNKEIQKDVTDKYFEYLSSKAKKVG